MSNPVAKAVLRQRRRFIDTVKLHVSGGHGGDGKWSFRPMGSTKKRPDGGHGGRGGDVIIRASKHCQTLNLPTYHVKAGSGANGGKNEKDGKVGKDAEILVPLGTVVSTFQKEQHPGWGEMDLEDEKDEERLAEEERREDEALDKALDDLFAKIDSMEAKGKELNAADYNKALNQLSATMQWNTRTEDNERVLIDLDEDGKSIVVATGGEPGRGNSDQAEMTYRFYEHEPFRKRLTGKAGTQATLRLTLKSIADIGLVGFPNAGKSTLLGSISKARPKVAPYAFTTLHPSIGYVEFTDATRISVADIPGIVEGAHENKGLGHSFLRHIERTAVLAYVIDCKIEGLTADFSGGREVEGEGEGLQEEEKVQQQEEEEFSLTQADMDEMVRELEEMNSKASQGFPAFDLMQLADGTNDNELAKLNELFVRMQNDEDPDSIMAELDAIEVNVRSRLSNSPVEQQDAFIEPNPDYVYEQIISRYAKLVHELEEYMEGLSSRPSLLILNKMDSTTASKIDTNKLLQHIVDYNRNNPDSHSLPLPHSCHPISAKFGGGIPDLVKAMRRLVASAANTQQQRQLQQ